MKLIDQSIQAYLRGLIDCDMGIAFVNSPYPEGLLRTQWQEGYMAQHKQMYPSLWAIDPIIEGD